MNTLFSAAVGNGAGLSEEEWKQFLLEITFPLIEQVSFLLGSLSLSAAAVVVAVLINVPYYL